MQPVAPQQHPELRLLHLVDRPTPDDPERSYRVIVQEGTRFFPLTMRDEGSNARVEVETNYAAYLLERMLIAVGASYLDRDGTKYIVFPSSTITGDKLREADPDRYYDAVKVIEEATEPLTFSAAQLLQYVAMPEYRASVVGARKMSPATRSMFESGGPIVELADPVTASKGTFLELHVDQLRIVPSDPNEEERLQRILVVDSQPPHLGLATEWPLDTEDDQEYFRDCLSTALLGTRGMSPALRTLIPRTLPRGTTMRLDAESAVRRFISGVSIDLAVELRAPAIVPRPDQITLGRASIGPAAIGPAAIGAGLH